MNVMHESPRTYIQLIASIDYRTWEPWDITFCGWNSEIDTMGGTEAIRHYNSQCTLILL